ncbi:MAG: T9SS type A sorting domain-containing protein [Bacteroidia bacterium]
MYLFNNYKTLLSIAIFMCLAAFSQAQTSTNMQDGPDPLYLELDSLGSPLQNPSNTSLPPVYINGAKGKGKLMYMEEDMYMPIKEWVLQGTNQTVPLDKFVEQRFGTKKAKDFLDNFYGDELKTVSTTSLSKGGQDTVCRCKFLVFRASGPQHYVIEPDPATHTEFSNTIIPSNNWHTIDRFYRAGTGAGRAEVSSVYSEQGHDINDLSRGPYYGNTKVTMRFLYACTNKNKLPSDCACDKTVRIQGEYRGLLRAEAGSGGIGTREAKSKVEAGAVLLDFMDNGDSIETVNIHSADLRAAYATRRVSWDPELVSSAVSLARSALMGIIAPGTDSTNLGTELADIIATVLTDDSAFVNESGGHVSNAINVNAPNTALTLKPGSERVIILTSIAQHYHDINIGFLGHGTSSTAFTSAYYLQAVIDFDDTNDQCCLERMGLWAQGGYHMNETGSANITDDPSSLTLSAMNTRLVTNFVGPWDSFNSNALFGQTTDSTELCGCNVRAGLLVTSERCDSVVIDISSSIYPDDYVLEIVELDADGDVIPGTLLSNTTPFTQLDDIINLSDINSPLGQAYNFEQSKFYRIALRVSGHCTDEDVMYAEFEAGRETEAKFDILSTSCDNMMIDISDTEGADEYRITVEEVDAQDNVVCCTQSTGWVSYLTNQIRLESSTGPLGYAFQGKKRYRITLDINGPCNPQSAPISYSRIVETSHAGEAEFTLTQNCTATEVMLDATASDDYVAYEIFVTLLNDFGNPSGPRTSITGGPVVTMNAIPVLDLTDYFTFTIDELHRVELVLTDECGGNPTKVKDFTFTSTPNPVLTGETEVCENHEYSISFAGSEAMTQFRIEVYKSGAFGNPLGNPIIDFTNGWINIANQNPIVDISPSNQITFQHDPNQVETHYTVKLYGRNGCSIQVIDRFIVVEVIASADCVLAPDDDEVAFCKAEIGVGAAAPSNPYGREFNLVDKSSSSNFVTKSVWSMGDGSATKSGTGLQYEYKNGGNYTLQLVIEDALGCKDSATHTVVVPTRTRSLSFGSTKGRRITDFNEAAFTVAPNPANDVLSIGYELDAPGSFVLLDLNGRVVSSQVLDPENTTASITTDQLSAGLYFGRVMQGNAMIVTHKILIKH